MHLGLFTPVFNHLDLDGLLLALRRFPDIRGLELGTGGWPGSSHLDLPALLDRPADPKAFRHKLDDAGLTVSALSCHGNPVHPQAVVAQRDGTLFLNTLRLAEQLGVPTVVTFSGCPGGSPTDATPNWITTSWPPEFAEALEWQWAERLLPYWSAAHTAATDHGVRIALEAHPGFCVYNTETLLRLRAAAGPNLGINLDPSHLWWQGMDIPTVIAALGPAIHHVHAKDVAIADANRNRNGVLDTKGYAAMADRSWLFRTVGWGHGELAWKAIVSALRLAGYDGVLSIEHEDALLSIDEGLASAVALLSRIVPREPPVHPWWI